MKPRLVAATALAATAIGAWGAAPGVVWTSMSHDFGAFDETLGTVHCTFEGVNTGDAPLMVLSARANCGCTTPRYSEAPVLPGDTLRITVGYDATGRPGRFSKNVVVTTNATPARATLTVSGTVIGTSNTLRGRYPVGEGALKLRTDALMFGDVPRNATGGRYIEGYNASADTLRPRVTGMPAYVSAIVSPAAVPPGENFVISTVFDPVACGLWDLVTDSLAVEIPGERIALTSVAVVTEDFSHLTPALLDRAPVVAADPAALDAGRLDPAVPRPVNLTLNIANRGREPMKLRRVYCTDPAVTLGAIPAAVKPGKKARIKVAVDPRALQGRKMLNSRIIVITNDPANPRTVVRLVGEVAPSPQS